MNWKTLALTFLLSASAQAAKHDTEIWLFGDSLSAPHNSWAELIDDLGYAKINNLSRGLVQMAQVTIPEWVQCDPGLTQVIIWLGSNDAYLGVPDAWFRLRFRDALQFLEGRDCPVTVMLPPALEGTDREASQGAKRNIIVEEAFNYHNVDVVDMPYPIEQTLDPARGDYHQSPGMHFWQAVYMINHLGLSNE